MVSCSKKTNKEISDEEATNRAVRKHIDTILELNKEEEDENEKITKSMPPERFTQIMSEKQQAIHRNATVSDSIDQLRLYSADPSRRDLIYDSYVNNKSLKTNTRLAFLLAIDNAPRKASGYQDIFLKFVEDESNDDILRSKMISIFYENDIKSVIPNLVKLYALREDLINTQIAGTLGSFGAYSLTAINSQMLTQQEQGSDNREKSLERLIDLSKVCYTKNAVRNITYSKDWGKSLYKDFSIGNDKYCPFQRMALDIVLNFADEHSYESIEQAINKEKCPENLHDLEYARDILDYL